MTMSKLDLTKIRETLIDEQRALAADIQSEQDKLQQKTEEIPDLLDLAHDRLNQVIVADLLSHKEQRLTQVQDALKRLGEGKYGICVKCGNQINPERLKAIPYAALCVNCQQSFEHKR
jgi:RNA polymerase-binding protein DksA